MKALRRWGEGGFIKGGGEEVGKGAGGERAGLGGEGDEGVGWGEFEEGLAARSAGLAIDVVEVGDDDGADADFGAELGDGRGDGGLLGAAGEAVRGVFDVAAGDDFSRFEEDGGAYEEMAVGGVGAVGGGFGLTGEVGELGGGDVGVGHGLDEGSGWAGICKVQRNEHGGHGETTEGHSNDLRGVRGWFRCDAG